MKQLNKIQDYLRLNHPTLWNLKLVHALLLAIVCNAVIFLLGYISLDIIIERKYDGEPFYSYSDEPSAIYFFSFILAVLSFIVWLIFYFRNNRVKRFYPITANKLYGEWLLSFVIISLFCLYPFMAKQGTQAKKRSYMTELQLQEGLNILRLVSILNPEDAGGWLNAEDSISNRYNKNSLLNYRGTYIDRDSTFLYVRDMLIRQDSVAIRQVMNAYLELLKGHIPQSNISADEWMAVVYKPPYYTVYRNTEESQALSQKLFISSLRSYYNRIDDGYQNNGLPWMLLVTLYFGLAISVTILACRTTSGRSWLIALVTHFVVMLLTFLLMFIVVEFFGYLLMWLFIYIGYIAYVCWFARKRRYKGKTPILMNLIITYSSMLFLFIYGVVYNIAETMRVYSEANGKYYYTNDALYNFLNDWNMWFLWGTLLLTIPLMYIVARCTLRWKALPEE